jgi:glycosyltransferase involved in cell wall biosynthesis
MKFYIIIPAHNEQDVIALTLNSLVSQTHLPTHLIVVNDNSTDETEEIVEAYAEKYKWISLINSKSSNEHLPGTKIINAFYKGYERLDEHYDIICKFDADLIFPKNYLEILSKHYRDNPKLGMAAGFCYIEKNDELVLESLTRK